MRGDFLCFAEGMAVGVFTSGKIGGLMASP